MSATDPTAKIAPSGSLARFTATLLRIARVLYVTMATIAVAVAILGLLLALYFEIVSSKGPSIEPVPPVPPQTPPNLAATAIDGRLRPPTNVRFVPRQSAIDQPSAPDTVLGHFEADTANGLAAFPNDIDILGGRDSELFDRARGAQGAPGRGANLVPKAALQERINHRVAAARQPEQLAFELEVIARDKYGMLSEVTRLVIPVVVAPQAAATASPAVSTRPAEATDLERLAREIAKQVAADGTVLFDSTVARALREPVACGTSSTETAFVATYRQIFEHVRQDLNVKVLPAFFDGICDAWKAAAAEQDARRVRLLAARDAVIAGNRASEFQYQFEAAAAWTKRNLTLMVVAAAVGVFLIVPLILAFLAIENHSNRMRDTLAALTELRRQTGPPIIQGDQH